LLEESRLLEEALYCEEKVSDGKGGYQKRFRMDIVIDSLTKALDLLTQMTASFQAFPRYSCGMVGLIIDKPVDLPSQDFGMGNIIANSFSTRRKSLTEVYNVVEVTFNDAEKNYAKETILVFDEEALAAGDPPNSTTVRAFCTNISQAIRIGRYALYVSKYINKSVEQKVPIDAILCQAGDKINISHDVPLWGFSGNLLTGNTTTVINLDREVTIEAGKTYEVEVRYGADVIEKRTVVTEVGTHTSLEVTPAFSDAPEERAGYYFGEENIVNKPFRLMGIERLNTDEVVLNAIEYNENVYDYVNRPLILPQTNYSALTFNIPPVTDLKLTERIVKMGDGRIEDAIDVWFQKPSILGSNVWAYTKAKIFLSDDDGLTWVYRGETTGNSFEIVGGLLDTFTYKVAVVACSNFKESSIGDAPSEEITLQGKSAAPSDVTGFIVKQSRDRLYMTWLNVSDVDLAGYEIRKGTSWGAGQLVATNIRQSYLIDLGIKEGALQDYWIKAIDTSGNYSENATQAILTVDNVPFTNIVESYSEQTAWGGTKEDTEVDGDNLVITPGSFLTGKYTTPVRDIGFVATAKIGIDAIATVAGDDTWEDFGEDTFADMDETMRFSGAELPGALSFRIKTSEDNITWTDWATWYPGDYKFRYFQLEMTMTRLSPSQVLECSQLNYYADLPDVDEFGEFEITDAGAGALISFTKEYHQIPSVNIDILTGSGYVHKFSVAPDLTDFTDKFYDMSGTAVTGTGRYHAHGV
jgi:hypothetical protein